CPESDPLGTTRCPRSCSASAYAPAHPAQPTGQRCRCPARESATVAGGRRRTQASEHSPAVRRQRRESGPAVAEQRALVSHRTQLVAEVWGWSSMVIRLLGDWSGLSSPAKHHLLLASRPLFEQEA